MAVALPRHGGEALGRALQVGIAALAAEHGVALAGGGEPHFRLSFHIDPRNRWLPDLDEMRLQVKYNPAIAGIALVNPDNPTGMVYPKPVLEQIVAIAREYLGS